MPTPSETEATTAPIPLCAPEIAGNEWAYVKQCLDTGWVSSVGAYVTRFENAVADFVGAAYGVATVNGTAALHLALLVAGVRPDDEVVMPTLTFIAPANAIRYAGAWPVFIDAEPNYWQVDIGRVRDFLVRGCSFQSGHLTNRETGRRVSAILPVHILGHPVDMDPVLELGKEYNLAVVEDATESLGATYKGRKAGCLGDIGCFSFNGNKIITTGGGGMIVTNNEKWALRARHLSTQAKADPLEYIHDDIGYNHRLTNIQAAMGTAQMEQLDRFIKRKRQVAAMYATLLAPLPGVTLMNEAEWASSIWWMYTILVNEAEYGMSSRALISQLRGFGVETRPLWQPMHLSPAHSGSFSAEPCPVATSLYRDAVSLPCSVGISDSQIRAVADHISALTP